MTAQQNNAVNAKNQTMVNAWQMLFLAWLIAFFSTLGALFIGEVLGQMPCLLCWYQRIAMFPLALILGIACFADDRVIWRYAMPLAGIGGTIALWHNLLYFDLVSEAIKPCGEGPSCTSANMTILGGVPLPLLSLGAFAAILLLLFIIRHKENA